MQMLRKIFLSICASVLSVSLIGLAWSHSLSTTLRDQETVKSWLADSGVYTELGASIVKEIAKESGSNLAAAAEDEAVQQTAVDALDDSRVLQTSGDQLIDGIYEWLESGELPATLDLDFSSAVTSLSESLGDHAAQRAASLPACTAQQTAALSAEYDVWSAPCRPPQLSAVQIGENTRSEIAASIDHAQTSIQTTELFDKNSEAPKQIRQAYQQSRWLPLIFTLLVILSTLGLVAASTERLKGLGRAGWIAILSGIAVGISAFFVSQGPRLIKSALVDTAESAAEAIGRLFEAAGHDIARMLWWYAAAYIAIGLLAAIIAKTINKDPSAPQTNNSKPPADNPPDATPVPSTESNDSLPPSSAAAPAKTTEKPSRPPRRIQL